MTAFLVTAALLALPAATITTAHHTMTDRTTGDDE